MSLIFYAVRASEGLFKPLRLQRYNFFLIYARKKRKKRHNAGTTDKTPLIAKRGSSPKVTAYATPALSPKRAGRRFIDGREGESGAAEGKEEGAPTKR